MQNEPNFPDDQMNVSTVITAEYENKTNWTLGENEPNTNPIRTQSNPIKANIMPKQNQYKPKQSQFQTRHLLINRMNQICCVYSFSVSFVSAKMALYRNNWNLKNVGRKKLNLLKYKSLHGQNYLRPNNWHNFCTLKSLEFFIY